MPPPSGFVAPTPEPKNGGGGIAGVFKSLTSGRGTKSTSATPLPPPSVPATALQVAQKLFGDARRGAVHGGPSDAEVLYEKVKPNNLIAERSTAAEALKNAVAEYPITGVNAIWYAAKDLVDPENPPDARRAGYALLTACVKHPKSSDMDRREYFDTLTENVSSEDFHLQLAALIELCKHGKDLSGFHYEATALLSRWALLVFDEVEKARRSAKTSKSAPKPNSSTLEETNFENLFNFAINVIKFNLLDDGATESLIDSIIYVVSHATKSSEVTPCVRVLDALVTYGAIPSSKLKDVVLILCSVHFLVKEARTEAWSTISNLCRSHNGHATITILIDVLRDVDERHQGRETVKKLRQSMAMLEKIMSKNGGEGFPLVPLALLVDALSQTLAHGDSKVALEVLRVVSNLFGHKDEPLGDRILEEDWTRIFDVAIRSVRESLAAGASADASQRIVSLGSAEQDNAKPSEVPQTTAQVLEDLFVRIEQILDFEHKGFAQRDDCIWFFSELASNLPDSCASIVINYYVDYRYCYPSDANWKANCNRLLDSFVLDRSRSAEVRLQALKAVTDVYEVVEGIDDYQASGSKRRLIDAILKGLTHEEDVEVVYGMTAFAVSICDNNESAEFESIMLRLHECMSITQVDPGLFSPSTRPVASTLQNATGAFKGNQTGSTPATVVTRAVIQIFMRAMDRSTTKAQRSFDEILWIARSNSCDTESRLSAMKMLFRLRADWANRIFLTPFTEADSLSATLYRTSESLAKKQAIDDAQQSRGKRGEESRSVRISGGQNLTATRAISGITRTLQLNHQLWMTPDPDALPEPPSNKASTLLVSAKAAAVATASTAEDASKPVVALKETLKINVWLETVIDLIQQDCDWEVYSYMLAHLPSQLANHSLFKAATLQIKLLRSVLCDQIARGSFHEPPISSGLRKTDVAICLYQVLTMVMSYHQHFSRGEEDEIVKCFIIGVNPESKEGAKCCIHSLSICLHEFPASIKTVLATLLLKMSQIITQSPVAVHILEFLAGLSRLPDLYANFREDDHRTVFGMCFRYLDSVRAPNTKTGRSSGTPSGTVSQPLQNSGPNPAISDRFDDLPQYVLSLAYHVITYWFLSLRLTDRGSHVSYIATNLVWADGSGNPHLDEQAVVTLDFMRRTAYADVDESRADEDFNPENHGEIKKERWLVGDSIITVEQATTTGWAQITKRQPSATSHYMVRQKFDAPQAHQVVGPADGKRDPTRIHANFFLPSNLPIQLLAPISDSTKPVHLPDDETISRAIRSIDRISTVDGHKVGIVYIGAGQTFEKDILPNVSGSTDYILFLSGLGTLTKLKGASFNTQGLDREFNSDGEFTICWRDRVTELVFHVTTMMPTNMEHDPQCTAKKRHIGNDFVNIIFNNSGNPFDFNTFPSEFNYVNIVITPESRASFMATRDRVNLDPDSSYYKVQVMSKHGFPAISPASETKILSLRALPEFIRLVALNASVFCLGWANRQGGEHVSSWRSRLREVQRLREKYRTPVATAAPLSAPVASGLGMPTPQREREEKSGRDSFNGLRRSSVANFLTNVEPNEPAGGGRAVGGGGEGVGAAGDADGGGGGGKKAEKQRMVDLLDFSKWA